VTDSLPPEDVASAVRHVLHSAVEAAIENWDEGHWDTVDDSTTVRDVLAGFSEYIDAWLEAVTDEDDPELAKTLLTISNEESLYEHL